MALSANYSHAQAISSLRIFDPSISPKTSINSTSQISDKAFQAFSKGAISALTDVFSDTARIDFLIVRIPVTASSKYAFDLSLLDARSEPSICSVSSPWAKIALFDKGYLEAYVILIWNERQLLVDASEDGTAHPPASLIPYSEQNFIKYAQQYSLALSNRETDTLVENNFPIDLGVLFRNAPQSTLIPFSENARATISEIARDSVPDHLIAVKRISSICASKKIGSYSFSNISEALEKAD